MVLFHNWIKKSNPSFYLCCHYLTWKSTMTVFISLAYFISLQLLTLLITFCILLTLGTSFFWFSCHIFASSFHLSPNYSRMCSYLSSSLTTSKYSVKIPVLICASFTCEMFCMHSHVTITLNHYCPLHFGRELAQTSHIVRVRIEIWTEATCSRAHDLNSGHLQPFTGYPSFLLESFESKLPS